MKVENGMTIGNESNLDYVGDTPYKSRFGYIPSDFDSRDYKYSVFASKEVLPKAFETGITSIKDQGNTGLCVGFSSASVQESNAKMRYGKSIDISPSFIYAESKVLDGDNEVGTSMRNALKVLKDKGSCEYSLMPFIDNEETKSNIFPARTKAIYDNAAKYKIDAYAQTFTVDEVKSALYHEGEVKAGFQVFETFMRAKDGFIGIIDGMYYGAHDVSFFGWDDDLERVINGVNYKGFLKFKNSWDKKWGDNGIGYLAYGLFDHVTKDGWWKLLLEAWTTIIDKGKMIAPNYHRDRWKDNKPSTNADIMMILGSKQAFVKGKEVTLARVPEQINGVTLVPIRFVAESMGLYVEYKPKERSIIAKGMGVVVTMKIGELSATINNQNVVMLAAPQERSGVTLVPLRFIAEAFGAKVDYNHDTKQINISFKE
ncbi:MAG TPA: hypothetical protein GX707_12965 [Epulopiscium sp.]|nr:hypothetical protein [Candidatus Epulonipiscium sp.]